MGNTTSMTRNDNHDDDALSMKSFETCDNGGSAPWSELNHDVFFVVMMQLRVIDFVSFSGVCKSWRSLALSNRKIFMASTQPMPMRISSRAIKKKFYCYLEDIEGRKFKTLLPHYAGRICVGSTCGFLILFGKKTRDFWLVNLITRHEIYLPCAPIFVRHGLPMIKAILVFSPLICGWVFIMLDKYTHKIWFCVVGKGEWNHVSTTFAILDFHVFKGKIYTINTGCRVYEMTLNTKLTLTLLEIKSFCKPYLLSLEFVSSGENLYVMNYSLQNGLLHHSPNVRELDFGEMKWVMLEKEKEKYALFVSNLNDYVVIKPEAWAAPWVDPRSQFEKMSYLRESGTYKFFVASMWYFPHECMNFNLIDE